MKPRDIVRTAVVLGVVLGVVHVLAAWAGWHLLDVTGVFEDINAAARQAPGANWTFEIRTYVSLGRVLALTVGLAVINLVVLTVAGAVWAWLRHIRPVAADSHVPHGTDG